MLTPPSQERQPIDWEIVESALYDWLNQSLELDDHIIFSDQNVPQPEYPYATLKRISEIEEGGDSEVRYRTLDIDGNEVVDPADAYKNQAIFYESILLTFSVQFYVDARSGANDPISNAMALASKAKRALSLNSIQEILTAGGLSVVNEGTINDTSVVVNGEWVSRASMDVVFRTASVMTEEVDIIEKVNVKSNALGVDLTIDGSGS